MIPYGQIWAETFATEQDCRAFLVTVMSRYIVCPNCKSWRDLNPARFMPIGRHMPPEIIASMKLKCSTCGWPINLLTKTYFPHSRIPMKVWFAALWQCANAWSEDRTLTAGELRRAVGGFTNIKTAQRVIRIIRHVYGADVWQGFEFVIGPNGDLIRFQHGVFARYQSDPGCYVPFHPERYRHSYEDRTRWQKAIYDGDRRYRGR